MGTPEFAVASLDALVQAGFPVVGVVTAPDKPAGRGMKLTESAVKKYALEKGLPTLQPEKLKSPVFLAELAELKADLQIVVAFRMLPELVWSMPPMGTVNLHGSLLPQYRGAAPIHWAVINGEKETGVTTFQLRHEIDTGNILLQESFPIGADETTGEVHDRMKTIGAALLVRTVKGLASGTLGGKEQDSVATDAATLKHAPKLFTETCEIHWENTADSIHNLVRGLSPFPGAFTKLDGKTLKIFRSSKEKATPASQPGIPFSDGRSFLKFSCADGYIQVLDLQLEGKKRMPVGDFLRGYKLGEPGGEGL
ncbi:methionyl-tRNA formyltransferase [Sediminibacterium sp. WSJ-3]|nr:methionyl-tRNA formyltransferase [Sediminibacterium soli]